MITEKRETDSLTGAISRNYNLLQDCTHHKRVYDYEIILGSGRYIKSERFNYNLVTDFAERHRSDNYLFAFSIANAF